MMMMTIPNGWVEIVLCVINGWFLLFWGYLFVYVLMGHIFTLKMFVHICVLCGSLDCFTFSFIFALKSTNLPLNSSCDLEVIW